MTNVQIVKSVEYLEVSMTSGSSTITANLTKGQDVTNCVPFYSSRGTNWNYPHYRANRYLDVYFASGQVKFDRSHNDYDLLVNVSVVEFDPVHVTVQQGSFYMAKTPDAFQTVNTTISGVDLDKTWVHVQFNPGEISQYHRRNEVMHKLTSTTNLQYTRYNTGGNLDINGHYYVVESDYFKVQQVEYTRTPAAVDVATTISGVYDREKTFLVSSMRFDGVGGDETYWDSICHEVWLDDSETLKAQSASAFGDIDFTTYVIELDYEPVASGTFSGKHVQHAQIILSGGSTVTYTNLPEPVADPDYACLINSSSHNLIRSEDTFTQTSSAAECYQKSRYVNNYAQIETERFKASNASAYGRIQSVQWWYEEPEETPDEELGQVVDSVQIVEVELPNGDYDVEVNLTEGQDISMCVPFITQRDNPYNPGAYASNRYCDIEFLSGPDRIKFSKGNNTGPNDIVCYVVEFNSTRMKVQQGSFSMADLTRDVTQTVDSTIVAVNTSRAFPVVHYTMTYANDAYISRREVMSWFAGSTKLRHSRYSEINGAISGHWYVVESVNAELAVQQILLTKPVNSYTASATIAEIDDTRTFILTGSTRGHGLGGGDDTYLNNAGCEAWFPSSTSVQIQTSRDDVRMDYCIHVITLNYNYASAGTPANDMVQRGRFTWATGDTTKTDDIAPLDKDYSMLVHSCPRVGMRMGGIQSGSQTTRMVTTFKFINDDTQIQAQRTATADSTGYDWWQLVNWYVPITTPEEQDEDLPDKVGAYDLIYSTSGYRMDVGTIRMADGTDKDVVVVIGLNYIRTYDADDPENLVEMDTFTEAELYEISSGRFTWPGTHNLRIVDHLSSPKAVLVDEGEQHTQCCQSFAISMSTWVVRDSTVVGYVTPICENSSMSISPYGSAISSASYDSSTGRIEVSISDIACGHGIFTISDDNTCCTYSTSHAVAVTGQGAWCLAGQRSAWYLQCTTNENSCTCTVYEGLYKKSWYTGWGHPGYCLGTGSISLQCGCGPVGNPANYCPCSGSTIYINAGNPPHCDGCTAGAHVASVSAYCWSSGCGCESGKYDHQCP